jgi:hypothetical protein
VLCRCHQEWSSKGARLADLVSSSSVGRSRDEQRRAVASLQRLVDEMLAVNGRVRETLLWLKANVGDLSRDLSQAQDAEHP